MSRVKFYITVSVHVHKKISRYNARVMKDQIGNILLVYIFHIPALPPLFKSKNV